jgi:hypothetical protein
VLQLTTHWHTATGRRTQPGFTLRQRHGFCAFAELGADGSVEQPLQLELPASSFKMIIKGSGTGTEKPVPVPVALPVAV